MNCRCVSGDVKALGIFSQLENVYEIDSDSPYHVDWVFYCFCKKTHIYCECESK